MVNGADSQCPKCGSGNCCHWPTDTQVWGPQSLVLQHSCNECHYTWIKCVSNPSAPDERAEDWP